MIYSVDRRKRDKAIFHFQAAIDIATPFDWHYDLCWAHYSLAKLFLDEEKFDDAQSHIQHTKPHVIDNQYLLARVVHLQAGFWYKQGRRREVKSEALSAIDIYERIGAVGDLEECRRLLSRIERNM